MGTSTVIDCGYNSETVRLSLSNVEILSMTVYLPAIASFTFRFKFIMAFILDVSFKLNRCGFARKLVLAGQHQSFLRQIIQFDLGTIVVASYYL